MNESRWIEWRILNMSSGIVNASERHSCPLGFGHYGAVDVCVFETVVIVLLTFLIIAGNLTVIFVFHCAPLLHHYTTSYFIQTMAYADLFVGVSCLVPTLSLLHYSTAVISQLASQDREGSFPKWRLLRPVSLECMWTSRLQLLRTGDPRPDFYTSDFPNCRTVGIVPTVMPGAMAKYKQTTPHTKGQVSHDPNTWNSMEACNINMKTNFTDNAMWIFSVQLQEYIQDSAQESVITRDIHRTFPAHDYFKDTGGDGQESLYKICKAYSVYDEDIGYCQGQSFLAAVLLLHMPEEQAFCVLVKIMYDYGLRDLYKNNFEDLHCKFYQLERLMQLRYFKKQKTRYSSSSTVRFIINIEGIHDMMRFEHNLSCSLGSPQDKKMGSKKQQQQQQQQQQQRCLSRIKDCNELILFSLQLHNCPGGFLATAAATSKEDLLQADFEGALKFFRVQLPKRYRAEENARRLMEQACNIKVSLSVHLIQISVWTQSHWSKEKYESKRNCFHILKMVLQDKSEIFWC
ncbi:hypothetical protein HPG69_005437 [Diceros bicornis minor]|uniref:Rab-GAP TBC domain-containing protein n=1 Tax=Diceros bicornis minor TaxID=77932 RepID=A0A7J7ELH8_DICBM|nr:hypothetical protein HPG69_005437 [Diceros bicornis minor]